MQAKMDIFIHRTGGFINYHWGGLLFNGVAVFNGDVIL